MGACNLLNMSSSKLLGKRSQDAERELLRTWNSSFIEENHKNLKGSLELRQLIRTCLESIPAHRARGDKNVELSFVICNEKDYKYTAEEICKWEAEGVRNIHATGSKRLCHPMNENI